jgi:hypothetical protein
VKIGPVPTRGVCTQAEAPSLGVARQLQFCGDTNTSEHAPDACPCALAQFQTGIDAMLWALQLQGLSLGSRRLRFDKYPVREFANGLEIEEASLRAREKDRACQ